MDDTIIDCVEGVRTFRCYFRSSLECRCDHRMIDMKEDQCLLRRKEKTIRLVNEVKPRTAGQTVP